MNTIKKIKMFFKLMMDYIHYKFLSSDETIIDETPKNLFTQNIDGEE